MARDSSIDIAKGIGITLVVFFHFVHLNKLPYFYEWGGKLTLSTMHRQINSSLGRRRLSISKKV